MFRSLRAIFRWNIYTGYFLRSYFFYNGSVVLVVVINCVYIYIYIYMYVCMFFCFGDLFAAVSMYVVDTIAYYYCYIFQY
jgi:hypothetical protein